MTPSGKGASRSGDEPAKQVNGSTDTSGAECDDECLKAASAARHEVKKCAEATLASGSSPLIMPKHRVVHEMVLLKTIAETLNQSHELSSMLHSVLEKLLELTGLTTGWNFLNTHLNGGGESHANCYYRWQ